MLLKKFLHLYLAPAGDDGSVVDRGDNFEPTTDAQDAAALAAKAPVAKEPVVAHEDEPETEEEKAEIALAVAEALAAEAVKAVKKKGGAIPLDRHEAVLTKEREARASVERELAQYKQGQVVAETNADINKAEDAITALEAKYAKFLTDGEQEKAVEVMAQLRKAERQIGDMKSDMRDAATEARAIERVRYDVAMERIEVAYPAINPDHTDFDKEVFAEVVELKVAYQRNGRTPTDALQRAVKLILGAEGSKQAAATTVAPRVDTEAVTAEVKKNVAAERKAAAIAKALATNQPTNTEKIGLNSDAAGKTATAKDVMKMSQKEFNTLSDDQLAILRGDVLA
jgi:hypothetical protein